MKGRSHIATNLFSASVVNSVFHVVDKTYSWHQLAQLMTSPQLLPALESQQFLHKVTYYTVIVLSARLPDIDQRVTWIGRLAGGHRGCTHSLFSILLLILFVLAISIGLPVLLLSHGIHLAPLLLQEIGIVLKAFVIGWALHLLADGLTRAGIPLFWPIPIRIGFPPFPALRFVVGTLSEDIVLWGIIFIVGFSLGSGLIGL